MSGLAKFFMCLGVFLVSLLPTVVVAITYAVIGPANFLESAIVLGVGGYFCAGIQIIMLLVGLAFIFFIATDGFD